MQGDRSFISRSDNGKNGKGQKMDKRTVLKAVVLSLAVLALITGFSSGAHAEKVLKVGILASLSGSQDQVGRELKDGALLAIERINKEWKDKGVQVEAVVADDGASLIRPEVRRSD